MQIEEFRQNRFVRNFVRDRWLILGAAGIVLLFSLIYATLIYKPTYASEAKVWIKDISTTSYLSSSGADPSYLRPLTNGSNPVMAQVEILNSHEMVEYLAIYVKQREAEQNGGRLPDKYKNGQKPNTAKIIKIKTEPNNDLIQVKLSWTEPMMARDMLGAALHRFDETNLLINRQIHSKKRAYLDGQLADIEGKLTGVRERIKTYQAGSMAVDVDTQTQELLKLRSQLVAQLESAKASRSNNAGYAAALQSQLAMSPRTALMAVALGSGNENLVKMRGDLALLNQQYAHDSVKQAQTNPQLMALKSQIFELKSQIDNEVRQTIGHSANAARTAKSPHIYDTVRSQLVQDLTTARTKSTGLGSEAASLRAAIARVDADLRNIPQSKFALAGLQEEEKTLSQAADELRRKQLDAGIKEAETSSNLFIVDAPTLPERASFPTRTHVLGLSMLLGLMAGFALSATKTCVEDRAEGAAAISEATRSRILGIIPWLARPVAPAQEDNVLSINDMAYKHIISNLSLEAGKTDAEVIAFTSTSIQKPYVGTAYQLAKRLSRLGHSVALIDADFRPSSLAQFVDDSSTGSDLGDLILDVDLKLRKGETVFPEDVFNGLRRDHHGVYLAVNRQSLDHAYDYFACRGFRHIVNMLKEQFDWVLIDTPSATLAPEFMAITQISDGVVLFADQKATVASLRIIAEKIREASIPLLGTIIREKNPQMELAHHQYVSWNNHTRGGGGGAVATANSIPLASRRVEFMGARIDALTMQETLTRIGEIIDRREKVQHVVVNVAKLMTMRRDPQLREIVNSSALVNADGAGVLLGAKLLGLEIPERVTGIDLMQQLIEMANARGYRIFFLGASEDVIRETVTMYKQRYPNLQICGYRNGYFRTEDEAEVSMQIRQAKPDILLVGMSSPKKEKFTRKYMEVMDTPFVMGVGGSFDVMAGRISRAPEWMQNSGMEWFYRFMQEPGRLWKRYLVTNAQYGWVLAGQFISNRSTLANGARTVNG